MNNIKCIEENCYGCAACENICPSNAIEMKPDCGKYYSQMARSYELKAEYDFALSYAKEAVIVEPNEALFYQRGLDLAKRIGRADEIENFERKVKYFRV